jgi:very-short-patch-repair endonuclease
VARHVCSTPLNKRVADLAERQHGAVSTRQLLDVGLSRPTISAWADAGRLHHRHRGVWSVGHARLSDEGRLWAAQLAKPGALLDGHTAAWAWKLLDPHPDPLFLVGATKKRQTKTLRIRTASPSPPPALLRGLRVTDLSTTLDHLPPALAQRARANAAYAGLLPRNDETESPLADKLLKLIRHAGLPEPEREKWVLGKRRDFVYVARHLIIETDGGRAHDNPVAFHEDRRRDAEALIHGWRTVRFTRQQIEQDPAYVIATLRALLDA